MKVEYLIIVDIESPFCRDNRAFDSFMQSDSDIKIQKNKLKHKNFEVDYEVQMGVNNNDKNRFFHVKLKAKDDENIDEFIELVRAAKSLFYKASDKNKTPQLLWDDLSFFFSEKSYPLIHEIENLMRKLITKFMLTNVGLGWTREAIPDELKKQNADKIENNNNYLYETDFIQLSDFLFNEYRTINVAKLVERLKEIDKNINQTTIAELKSFIPLSNWERYFRAHVQCEGDYLKNRWEKLYKLRCKIAHNNVFSKNDFESVVILVNEIKPKIQSAIDNLENIKVPEEERDDLVEVVAINANALHGDYIQKWKFAEELIYRLAVDKKLINQENEKKQILKFGVSPILKRLLDATIISPEIYKELKQAHHIRNVIVHEVSQIFSEGDIIITLKNLDNVIEYLLGIR